VYPAFKLVKTVQIVTPSPIHRGTGDCFRSISLFVCLYLSLFLC